MAQQKKPLSKALKTFFGVGDLGFSWMASIESYYFNFFLTDIAQFALPVVTMITTVTSMVDALLSWIYGAILDSVKPMKWGRYRSWLAVVPWVVPILYFFEFFKVGEGTLAVVVIIVGTISSHILWNIPWVANMTLISVASGTPEDRIALSAVRSVWENIAHVLYSYVGPFTVALIASALGERYAYAGTAFLFGAIMAALYFAHFKLFEGYEETEPQVVEKAGKKDDNKTGAGDLIKALFQNPPLLVFLIAEFGRWLWNFILMGMTMYYFTYVAQNVGMMPVFLLITSLLGIVGAYAAKLLGKKLTARVTYIFSLLLMITGPFAAYFLYGNMYLVIIFMAFGRFGYACSTGLSGAIYSDIIIYNEWKTGKNAAGWIMGLQNVPLKVSVICRGLFITSVLAAGGFVTGMDVASATPELISSICFGFMLVPAIACVVSLVLFNFGFKITQDKVEQYTAEIAARKK